MKTPQYNTKMSPFHVRVAQPADHHALARVLADLLGRPELGQSLSSALNTNLLRLLSQPGASLLVAEGEDDLLGLVSLWTRWGLFDDAPIGLIDRLVVRAAWQETAVPPALLEQAVGACSAMGCRHIEMAPTEDSLVPLEALERFGFIRKGGRFGLELL